MNSREQALVTLVERAIWFVRDREARLLYVRTDAGMRGRAVDLLLAQQYDLDNTQPFYLFEDPHSPLDPGWEQRAFAARMQHEALRESLAAQREALGELPPAPSTTGVVGFAEQLGQCTRLRPVGTDGIVALLVPAYVTEAPTWDRTLSVLMQQKALSEVRWILVDGPEPSARKTVELLGRKVVHAECLASSSDAKAGLAQALNPSLLAIPGPLGARPKHVVPPRRVDDPPATAPSSAAERELAASKKVLEASLAADQGDFVTAVAKQREARDHHVAVGMPEQAVVMELVLASYLVGGKALDRAIESYIRAADRARAAGLLEKAAVAHFARGSCHVAQGQRPLAMMAYAEGTVAAEQAQVRALAIEGARLTGDLADDLGQEIQAIAFWSRAVRLAEEDLASAPTTSAGRCALSLALLCERRGHRDRAVFYRSKAQQLGGLDVDAIALAEPIATEPMPLRVEAAPAVPNDALAQSFAAESPAAEDPAPAETARASIMTTAPLSLAQLAALQSPAESIEPREWAPAEENRLLEVTRAASDPEITDLLTNQELAILRGEAPAPVAQPRPPEQTARFSRPFVSPVGAKPSDDAETTLRYERNKRGEPPTVSTPAGASGGTVPLTREQIRALRSGAMPMPSASRPTDNPSQPAVPVVTGSTQRVAPERIRALRAGDTPPAAQALEAVRSPLGSMGKDEATQILAIEDVAGHPSPGTRDEHTQILAIEDVDGREAPRAAPSSTSTNPLEERTETLNPAELAALRRKHRGSQPAES